MVHSASIATVSPVGVGTGVDGAGGRGALSPASTLQDACDQEHDCQHQEEGGDGDADRKLPHGDAEFFSRSDPLQLLTCGAERRGESEREQSDSIATA